MNVVAFFSDFRKKLSPPILFLLGLTILAIVLYILRWILLSTYTKQGSWNSIVPGKSTLEDVQKTLGAPLEKTQEGDKTVLKYQSDFPVYPHEVIAVNNTVSFIKEWVPYEANKTLEQYIQTYGQPDFTTYTKETPESFTLHVFLSRGIAVNAQNISHRIFHVWYFQPVDKEQFLTIFADLIETNPNKAEGVR